MLPNMSSTLTSWSSPYTIKTITRTTADFVEVIVVATRTANCVIQPAQKEKLNADQIDWSLRYLQVHSNDELKNGEYLVFGGEDYKIIDDGNYQLYGYSEVIAEETNQPPIVATT